MTNPLSPDTQEPEDKNLENKNLKLLFSDKEKWQEYVSITHQSTVLKQCINLVRLFKKEDNWSDIDELFNREKQFRSLMLIDLIGQNNFLLSKSSSNATDKKQKTTFFLKKIKTPSFSEIIFSIPEMLLLCKVLPRNIELEGGLKLIKHIDPLFEKNPNFESYMISFFSNANLNDIDELILKDKKYVPMVGYMVDFINRNEGVLNKFILPNYFTLKERKDISDHLEDTVKKKSKTKKVSKKI